MLELTKITELLLPEVANTSQDVNNPISKG